MNLFQRFRKDRPTSGKPSRRKWAALGLTAAVVLGGGAAALLAGAGYMAAASPTVRSVIAAVARHDITPDRAFPGQDSVTLLLVGADQDRDNRKRVVGQAQRSDTLMVARVDFVNNRIGLVSIPRDTKIRIPGYRGYQKINAAFAYGGTDLAKKTVEGLLGVTIDDSVVINFDGFKKVVDLLGGVPVTVDKPLHYDDNWGDLHVHLEPGEHVLNGQEALGYVRIRKVDSDTHRAARQQAFLQAVRAKLQDPRAWLKIPAIIEAIHGSLDTNLDDNQLLCLGAFAKNLPEGSMQTATLPGHEGRSFVTLYPDKVRDVARALLGVEEAPLDGLGVGRDRTVLARRDREDRSDEESDKPSRSERRARQESQRRQETEKVEWRELAEPDAPSADEFNAPLSQGASETESVPTEEAGSSKPSPEKSPTEKPPVKVQEIAPSPAPVAAPSAPPAGVTSPTPEPANPPA